MSKDGGSKGPIIALLGGASSSLLLLAVAIVAFFLLSKKKSDDSIGLLPVSSNISETIAANSAGSGRSDKSGASAGAGASTESGEPVASGAPGSGSAATGGSGAAALNGSQIEISGGFCAAPTDVGVQWVECDSTDPLQRWEYRNATGNVRSLGDTDKRCLTHDVASDNAKLSACKTPASTDQRWGLAESTSSNLRPMSGNDKCLQAENDDPAGNPDIRVTNCGVTENGGTGKAIRNIRELLGLGTELRVYPTGQRPRTLSVGGKCMYGDGDGVNSRGGGYCLPANTEWTYGTDGTLRWNKGRCLSLDTSTSWGAPTEGSRLTMKDCSPGNPEQRWREQDGKLRSLANTRYCATRTASDDYVLSRCDRAGTSVAGVSSELFADIPRSSLDPAVKDVNTDNRDDGLDYKRARIRSVSHPTRCLKNVNGRLGLVPCDSAQWFRYDPENKQLRLYDDGAQFACVRHMGHAKPAVIDANCPAGDAATMFYYEKTRSDSETGRIRMSNVNNQCIDIPAGNANADLQTFTCNNGNNQLFYSDATPEGEGEFKDMKGRFGKNIWGIA